MTSPKGAGRGIEGIRAHRATLESWEICRVDGIPTTSVARTLLDLAETIHREALRAALDRAEVLRIFDLADLERVLSHNRGRHGLRPLRDLLRNLDPATKLTRNDFERRFYGLCDAAGLPRPIPNQWLHLEGAWIEADFSWPDARFIVETDGWETHRTRQAFERDRAKDALLLRAGVRVARVTWRRLLERPGDVTATIRAGLQPP